MEVEVLWGSRSQRPRANRKAKKRRELSAVRPARSEAGSETARRRTETGYEALPSRASGPLTAKLTRPRRSGVDPAPKAEEWCVECQSSYLGRSRFAPERATLAFGRRGARSQQRS